MTPGTVGVRDKTPGLGPEFGWVDLSLTPGSCEQRGRYFPCVKNHLCRRHRLPVSTDRREKWVDVGTPFRGRVEWRQVNRLRDSGGRLPDLTRVPPPTPRVSGVWVHGRRTPNPHLSHRPPSSAPTPPSPLLAPSIEGRSLSTPHLARLLSRLPSGPNVRTLRRSP